MKTTVPPTVARTLALHYLPAFLWVAQEPGPVWSAVPGNSSRSRVQAVGTATEVGGDKFVAWSSTDALLMGGATTTAPAGCFIKVHTAP
ncbi:hypothetical protein [Hymenobacter nivis]|uniref:Uncharacterized protein n=1 Tax=Hymenobacter nivis TaxID=1850093 RepID=A0A502GZ25_9BACT|nr:hypothetical protein [Hymenobacter nivis]TPG67104.1 hypothetical protein EAH73_05035 [Hymenobacter nivis]